MAGPDTVPTALGQVRPLEHPNPRPWGARPWATSTTRPTSSNTYRARLLSVGRRQVRIDKKYASIVPLLSIYDEGE